MILQASKKRGPRLHERHYGDSKAATRRRTPKTKHKQPAMLIQTLNGIIRFSLQQRGSSEGPAAQPHNQ